MARLELDPECMTSVRLAAEKLLDERIGPEIADDARRYCPVDTGALKASIEHHMDGGNLIVSATGGGVDGDGNLFVSRRAGTKGSVRTRKVHHVDEEGRAYAEYVEMGHLVYHPSTGETGPERVPAQSFLRRALYQERHG